MKQETQEQQVSMKVNQANLVKGLKYSFTNKTTVLGELMQNARRAGATQVAFEFDAEKKQLVVRDDGCGIDSMETLLTVAESGWDAKTLAEEHPFGIGFLSVLFACQHVTVLSGSNSLSVKTSDVLSMKPVAVNQMPYWDGKTEIIMKEINLSEDEVKSSLETLAKGFPISVVYNNKELDRPIAIDSGLQFIKTEIGSIYLNGLDTATDRNTDFEIFLQGLPLNRSRYYLYGTDHHVIHLDSSSFYARLPDREKLINEDEVVAKIRSVLAKTIEQQLVAMKSTLSTEAFVSFYSIMNNWNLLRLLNDVPLVPKQALNEITEYPNCNTDAYGSFEWKVDKPLSRDEIEARGIVSINEDMQESGAAHYLFIWKKDYLIYTGNLDAGHWLHSMIVPLNDDSDLTVEIINESHQSYFKGSWAWLNVCFCGAYKIHIGNEFVEISDMALFTGNEDTETGIIPKGDDSADVLNQAYSFRNEHDEFQESSWESDRAKFISFVVANTSKDTAEAMKRLLPSFTSCPSLYDESFVITLDKVGNVESVALDYPY